GAWERRPGSIGCREWPGNVIKGKKMPGHMGNVRRTVQNLKVVRVMADDNVLLVRGAIPGPNGGMVIIKKAIKKG
ncbi:MAG: 50S ribosomal protein L3, partial [Lentisphaeria bacterium]|nr:50S ribosomal protein L3 [Lentisphaeria bacterium]